MKKKLFVFLMMAILVCALSACGCQHEWSEANCTAAKTCAECGETEGEALGHDFAAATCTAAEVCARCGETRGEALGHEYISATCTEPETCTRCGETQGEAMGHTYGYWTAEVEGDTMTHQCAVCALEETVALDYTRILEEEMKGFWDFYYIQMNGQMYDAYHLKTDSLGMYLNFREGNHADFYMDQEGYPKEVTWEFDYYENMNGDHCYYFYIVEVTPGTEGADTMIPAFYMTDAAKERSSLVVVLNSNEYIALDRNQWLAEVVEGTWAGSEDGQIKTISFAPDRTFTANVGEEISGTWHLKPVYNSGGYRYCNILLRYSKDGSSQVVKGHMDFGSGDVSLDEYVKYYDPYLSFYQSGAFNLTLTKMTEEEIDRLETATAEGKQILLGPWTSSYISTYSNGSSNETRNEEYSITFAEDGTFTAVLDQERSGTWSSRDVTVQDSYTGYSYYLNFKGVADTVYAYLSDEELSFSKHDPRTGISTSIHFLQMTEEKIAQREAAEQEAAVQVVGDWNSLNVRDYKDENNTQYRTALDYTISIKEDGTFTAVLDKERTGAWEFRDSYSYDDGYGTHTSYSYTLYLDGVEQSIQISVGSDGELSWYVSDGDHDKTLCFFRHTPEAVEALRKAQKEIVGTWTVDSADLTDKNTWTRTPFADCGYTLTVREDGTYTAEFDKTISGTWACEQMRDESRQYVFAIGRTGHTYSMDEDGVLYIWYDIDENTGVHASMKKAE